MYKENKGLFFLCGYIIVANWIYVGTLSFGSEPIAWSGGIAWGPRYLIPVLPFIMIILGNIFLHLNRKRTFLRIIVIGFVRGRLLCKFKRGSYLVSIWTYVWLAERRIADYPNSLDIMAWLHFILQLLLHTKAIIADYVSSIIPAQYLNTSWYWATYGNAPCPYDLYIYCEYGIVPVIIISLSLIVIAALVVRELDYFRVQI